MNPPLATFVALGVKEVITGGGMIVTVADPVLDTPLAFVTRQDRVQVPEAPAV
jgi:hypothetical protein